MNERERSDARAEYASRSKSDLVDLAVRADEAIDKRRSEIEHLREALRKIESESIKASRRLRRIPGSSITHSHQISDVLTCLLEIAEYAHEAVTP